MNSEERFTHIEMAIASNKVLAGMLDDENVKPLSEETPPPHY